MRRPRPSLASLLLGLLLLGPLLLWGCEENLDPATPEGALHHLRDAVMAADVQRVLALSSATTQKSLAELHTLLKEQRVAIAERYPEEHRAPALTAFPEGALDAADSAELFAVLVKPQLEALDRADGLRYGLSALGKPTVKDGRASVPTNSGETVELVLEDGAWKTTAFERRLEQNLNRARLNQQTLNENLKVFEELKRREAERKAREAAADPAAANGTDAAAP